MRAALPSRTSRGAVMVRNWRSAGCSTMPARVRASTKGRLLPSMPGTSGPVISISRLSRPSPASAACNARWFSMASAPDLMAVRRERLVTCWTRAGMRTGRERSVRTKTMPWPTGAGLKVRVAGAGKQPASGDGSLGGDGLLGQATSHGAEAPLGRNQNDYYAKTGG